MANNKAPNPSNYDLFKNLVAELGLEPSHDVQIIGQDPVTTSPHRIGDAAAVALAALGAELVAMWGMRTGVQDSVKVHVDATVAQLMAVYLTTVNGVSCARLLEDKKMFQYSDFYQAKNGRWVFLLNTYPHLRDINCRVLNCPFTVERLTECVREWDAFELEEKISSLGGTCIVVRSQQEWIDSPQGSLLVDTPLVSIEKLADSKPIPLSAPSNPESGLPLQGVRVLDNTHVIAGPMTSRIAAEYGAEVLTIASPDHLDPRAMVVETGIGKRSSFCDLEAPGDIDKFFKVLAEADVYVNSYLSLDKKGFGPEELIRHCPGLIYVDFHAWGKEGPWLQRGGFDQLACSATGFSAEEAKSGRPSLPPTHLLNDYLAAIIGAAGIVEALRRRSIEGGSWRVHVNLSRVCMWVQSMGLFSPEDLVNAPAVDAKRIRESAIFKEVDGCFGKTRYLPTQIQFSAISGHLAKGSEPTGASALAWA